MAPTLRRGGKPVRITLERIFPDGKPEEKTPQQDRQTQTAQAIEGEQA